MKVSKVVLLGGLLLPFVVACGGGGEDAEPGIVDQIIASQLDFDGVFADSTGLTIELDGELGIIRALGTSDFSTKSLMKVGEKLIMAMTKEGPGLFKGFVATQRPFLANDPNSFYMPLERGSVTIQNGKMSITDGAGRVRNFDYVGPTWNGPSAPPTSTSPGTGANPGTTTTPTTGTGSTTPSTGAAVKINEQYYGVRQIPGITVTGVYLADGKRPQIQLNADGTGIVEMYGAENGDTRHIYQVRWWVQSDASGKIVSQEHQAGIQYYLVFNYVDKPYQGLRYDLAGLAVSKTPGGLMQIWDRTKPR